MADEDSRIDSLDQLQTMVTQMGTSVAEALVRGLEESGVVQQVLELLQNLQERIDSLENKIAGPPRQEPAKKPVAAPPIAMPLSRPPSLSLPASRPRPRTRNVSRPTVTYRTDPRAKAKPENEENKICSDAGCQRPARSRGLCSLHYQRLRYRERKIEHKQETVDPLPPPPPSGPVASSVKKRNGGTKGIFAVLYEEKGCKQLAGLINQIKYDRSDVTQKLNNMYQGMPGIPLEDEDVVRAIHYHKLGDAMRKRERDIICRHLTKQRGSLFKSAQKMKTNVEQLGKRIRELEMEQEAARIRNEFKDAILETSSFNERLTLALTKEKYLEDLGIVEEVDASLRRELTVQIDKLANGHDLETASDTIREALSLDEERFRRLLKRFDLDASQQSPKNDIPATGGP